MGVEFSKNSDIEYEMLNPELMPRRHRKRSSVVVTAGLIGGPVGQISSWNLQNTKVKKI